MCLDDILFIKLIKLSFIIQRIHNFFRHVRTGDNIAISHNVIDKIAYDNSIVYFSDTLIGEFHCRVTAVPLIKLLDWFYNSPPD